MTKKLIVCVALLISCLFALSACSFPPLVYYMRRALKIDTECSEYSLKPTSELTGEELSHYIGDEYYVDTEFLLNPANDDADDIEFYNENGLYVYMSKRVLHVFNNGVLYDLTPKYFRENSQAYNKIEQIWADKDDIEPSDVPNYIVGAIVFDDNLFILAQNRAKAQLLFNHEHTANLWKFDPSNGQLAFCGFCVKQDESGKGLLSLDRNAISIVKNK